MTKLKGIGNLSREVKFKPSDKYTAGMDKLEKIECLCNYNACKKKDHEKMRYLEDMADNLLDKDITAQEIMAIAKQGLTDAE